MGLRKTKLYKELNSYKACSIAEGFCEGEGASEQDQLIAWQYIYDKGLYRGLQGFYGRTCKNLLDNGYIKR
jgi:hypothetical protein